MEMSPIEGVKIEEVIMTVCIIGDGTEKSPYTQVVQYWTKSGKFIGQIKS